MTALCASHPVFGAIRYYVEQEQNNAVFIIMRGLPGSGKSTLAREILTAYGSDACGICSADNFFYSQSGVYCYNPEFITDAHAYCRKTALHHMSEHKPIVILDNTNIRMREFVPYLSMAATHRYNTIVTEPNTPWKFDVRQLAARNSHSVQKKKLHEMLQNYDKLKLVDSGASPSNAGPPLADALVSDTKRGTVYCVKIVILPTPADATTMPATHSTTSSSSTVSSPPTASASPWTIADASKQQQQQQRRKLQKLSNDYRHPDMIESFQQAMERVSLHAGRNWSNFLPPPPQANPAAAAVAAAADLQAPSDSGFDSTPVSPLPTPGSQLTPKTLVGHQKQHQEEQQEDQELDECQYLASMFPELNVDLIAEVRRANGGANLAGAVDQLREISDDHYQHQRYQTEQHQHQHQPSSSPAMAQLMEIFPGLPVDTIARAVDANGGSVEQAAAELSLCEEHPPHPPQPPPTPQHPLDDDAKDDDATVGFVGKRALLAIHRRLRGTVEGGVGGILEHVDDSLLASWRPPDAALWAIYAAFLDHIGVPCEDPPPPPPPASAAASSSVARRQQAAKKIGGGGGVGLRDIMLEEEAEGIGSGGLHHSNSWSSQTTPLTHRYSLQRLARDFPGLSEAATRSLFADCGHSYEATHATLLEYGLTPAEPASEPDQQQQHQQQEDPTTDLPATDAGNGSVYAELSRLSVDYRARRRDCLERAAYARDPRAQAHYMREADSLTRLERQGRAELVMTASATASASGAASGGLCQLDVHGMTATEAIQAIKATCSSGSGQAKIIRVITGHGKHSNSGPVLHPVVKNFFCQKGLQFSEPYLGCFEVRLV